jgi:hypothetical protein
MIPYNILTLYKFKVQCTPYLPIFESTSLLHYLEIEWLERVTAERVSKFLLLLIT